MDLFQKIKGIVGGLVEAVSRVDLGRTVSDAAQDYLEKRFKVEIFPASASDGSIEFHTRDGRLFATLGSVGGIRVETGGAVYFFTVEEILKVKGTRNHKENSCAPEGREAVIGDDGAFKGVHDYDRQQSIPADEAISVYSEEELFELIENETLALQNAAKRHAEEAPAASSKKKAAPKRVASAQETRRPGDANQALRDELAGQTDRHGRIDVSPVRENAAADHLPELLPNQQAPVAFLSHVEAQRPVLPIEPDHGDFSPLIQSAGFFAASSNDSEDSPRRPESKNSPEPNGRNAYPQTGEGATILAGAHALIEDVGIATAESFPSMPRTRISRIEPENSREAAASPHKDIILYVQGVHIIKQDIKASLRAGDHAAISAEYCTTGNSKFGGADSRVNVLGSMVLIEDDPMAIAWAQSDKGGLPPISLIFSMIKGGHSEKEMSLRLNVEALHAKRDLGDQRDGKGQNRDESSDEWDTLYEEGEPLFSA